MADRPAPPAQSLYKGIRVTLTANPDGTKGWLNVSAKSDRSRWDDWDLLLPALPVDLYEITSASDVLRAARAALDAVLEALDPHA